MFLHSVSTTPKLINFLLLFFHSSLNPTQTVLLTHGDSIDKLGDKLTIAGVSGNGIVAALYNAALKIYGVQFHPEVDLTSNGKQMLSNFLFSICGMSATFSMGCRKESCMKYVRDKVGNSKVLVNFYFFYFFIWLILIIIFFLLQLLVSGGVDSTVCAALLSKCLNPNQIIIVHIDNGEFNFFFINY